MKDVKRIKAVFVNIIDDLMLLAGITFITLGAFKIYEPAGYITLGSCLIAIAFIIAKRGGEKD